MKGINIPAVIVNFKTYREATGKGALKLAGICKKYGAVCAVQTAEIYDVAKSVKTTVIAQHIDNIDYGKNTGSILAQSVKEAGAVGTLINHSERRLKTGDIKGIIQICKKLKMYSVACARTPEEAAKIARFRPDFIAIEPPELIGGKIAVSEAEPEIITESVEAVKKVNKEVHVLCGAGIHTRKDVEKAVELGASGILVASGVVKARNQDKELKELIKGLNKNKK